MKFMLLLGLIGHIFCGASDWMPRWACIFNLLPLAVVTLPTKLPAKANVIGAGMFLGLLFLM